jgi:hypothetical protein
MECTGCPELEYPPCGLGQVDELSAFLSNVSLLLKVLGLLEKYVKI